MLFIQRISPNCFASRSIYKSPRSFTVLRSAILSLNPQSTTQPRYSVATSVLHRDSKYTVSTNNASRATDALPPAPFVCVRVRMHECADTSGARATCVHVERRILFREARNNGLERHARHNGANLFNLTNNKLISWLTRSPRLDRFARRCAPIAFHVPTPLAPMCM